MMLWYKQVLSAIGIFTNGYASAYIKKKFNLQLSANYLMWLDSLSSTAALTGLLLSGLLEIMGKCFVESFFKLVLINAWVFYNSLNAWSKYKKVSTSINQQIMTWKSDGEIIRMAHIGITVLVLYWLTTIWANSYYELASFPIYNSCIGTPSKGLWFMIPNMVFVFGKFVISKPEQTKSRVVNYFICRTNETKTKSEIFFSFVFFFRIDNLDLWI